MRQYGYTKGQDKCQQHAKCCSSSHLSNLFCLFPTFSPILPVCSQGRFSSSLLFPSLSFFSPGEKNIVEGNHPPFLPSLLLRLLLLLLLLFLSPPKMSLCTLSHSTFHSFFSFFSTFGKKGGGASGFLRKNYCLCRRKRRKGGESIWAPTDRPTPSLWVFGFLGLLEIQTLSCVYDKPRTNCQNFDNKLYSLSKTTTTSSSTTTLTVFRQSGPKKGR